MKPYACQREPYAYQKSLALDAANKALMEARQWPLFVENEHRIKWMAEQLTLAGKFRELPMMEFLKVCYNKVVVN